MSANSTACAFMQRGLLFRKRDAVTQRPAEIPRGGQVEGSTPLQGRRPALFAPLLSSAGYVRERGAGITSRASLASSLLCTLPDDVRGICSTSTTW